jgi:hypothetical protein
MSQVDIELAKQWCNTARKLLSFASTPGTDRYRMGKDVDSVGKALTALQPLATTPELQQQYKAFVLQFKFLATSARQAEHDRQLREKEKVARIKEVSEGLSLLKTQIKLAVAQAGGDGNESKLESRVNVKQLPIERKAFATSLQVVERLLNELQSVAPVDAYRTALAEVESIKKEEASATLATVVAEKKEELEALLSPLRGQIASARTEQGKWTATKTARQEFSQKLTALSSTGVFAGERESMTNNHETATRLADTLHDYPAALNYWTCPSWVRSAPPTRNAARWSIPLPGIPTSRRRRGRLIRSRSTPSWTPSRRPRPSWTSSFPAAAPTRRH